MAIPRRSIMNRVNPFADLDDIEVKPKKKLNQEDAQKISQIAEQNGFPSRQAKVEPKPKKPEAPAVELPIRRGRRLATERTMQFNVRANPTDVARFYQLADDYNVPLGELLKMALDALEKKRGG
jgi:hypothetical protein